MSLTGEHSHADALPDWLRPHIESIKESRRAGFSFLYLPNLKNIAAIQGFRQAHGAMDVYSAASVSDAVAARYRLDDLDRNRPCPLWTAHGSVSDVVTELLRLPPHGSPGAPSLALALPGDLSLPSTVR